MIKQTRIIASCSRVSTTAELHHLDFNEMSGEKAWLELRKEDAYCLGQNLKAELYSTATVQLFISHLANHWSKTSKTYRKNKDELISDVFDWNIHMDTLVLTYQQKVTPISSVWISGVVKRIYLWQWPVGTDSKRNSKEFVYSVYLNVGYDDLSF